jgi:hypothetical protein
MPLMKRTFVAILAGFTFCLALPAVSPATLTDVGVLPATTPPSVPSCPASPCLAVSRTTGFQVKVGAAHNFLAVPRSGTIVAWTIMLGKPSAAQIKFFNTNEGGPSQAGIAILRLQPKPNLTYKLVAQSPPVMLQPYFGQTVPTWAPALALGFGRETSWRASRPRSQCASTSALSTHTQVGSPVQYYCLYQTARLTYTATLISTP